MTHEYTKQKKPPMKKAIHAVCDSVLTRFLRSELHSHYLLELAKTGDYTF